MTIWQKISGLATRLGDAGSDLLGDLAGALRLDQDGKLPHKDIAFTIAVIALSAKMANADGHVSARENEAFDRVFRVDPGEEDNVRRVFDLAKQDTAGYESYADQIAKLLAEERRLLQHVLEGLLYIAAADGGLHPSEDAFLGEVAKRFGFSTTEYRYFRARFVHDYDNPFDVLKLSPDASEQEIKAQYRLLVRNNHPDKLMGDGVPREFIELANRKLAAINAAYETIARERRL